MSDQELRLPYNIPPLSGASFRLRGADAPPPKQFKSREEAKQAWDRMMKAKPAYLAFLERINNG